MVQLEQELAAVLEQVKPQQDAVAEAEDRIRAMLDEYDGRPIRERLDALERRAAQTRDVLDKFHVAAEVDQERQTLVQELERKGRLSAGFDGQVRSLREKLRHGLGNASTHALRVAITPYLEQLEKQLEGALDMLDDLLELEREVNNQVGVPVHIQQLGKTIHDLATAAAEIERMLQPNAPRFGGGQEYLQRRRERRGGLKGKLQRGRP